MQNRKSTRKTFISLMLIFIIPMLASWVLFHYHAHFSLKTTNHGTLVNPPFNVNALWADESDTKKWQIIYVSSSHCDSECENIFHSLNQVKKALGKNSNRVVVKKIEWDGSVPAEFIKKDFVIDDKVYLIDPLGNFFMYYADTTDPMHILKDMKRVLEVSQIG